MRVYVYIQCVKTFSLFMYVCDIVVVVVVVVVVLVVLVVVVAL